MKKMISYSLLPISILLVVYFGTVELSANSILLKGHSYRVFTFVSSGSYSIESNKPKEIKSVTIKNLANGAVFETNSSFVTVAEILSSSVNNKTESNQLSIEYLSKDLTGLNLLLHSGQSGNLRIKITDINGRILSEDYLNVTEGYNQTTLYATEFSDGYYQMQITGDDGFISVQPFLVIGNKCFLKSVKQLEELRNELLSSGYMFIAHPTTNLLAPDTVIVESLDDVDRIDFYFKDNSEFNFRKGKLRLQDLKVEFRNVTNVYSENHQLQSSDTSYSNEYLTIEMDLRFFEHIINFNECREIHNTDNFVYFCEFSYCPSCKPFGYINTHRATISINSEKKELLLEYVEISRYQDFSVILVSSSNKTDVEFNFRRRIPVEVFENDGKIASAVFLEQDHLRYFNYLRETRNDSSRELGFHKVMSYTVEPGKTLFTITLEE